MQIKVRRVPINVLNVLSLTDASSTQHLSTDSDVLQGQITQLMSILLLATCSLSTVINGVFASRTGSLSCWEICLSSLAQCFVQFLTEIRVQSIDG